MKHARLVWVFFRLGALNELQYRANFAMQVFQSLVSLGTALAGLSVIFSHTASLGGWRRDELLALLGIFFLVGGLINMVIQPSMQRFMEDVRLGTLDFVLTKPRDAQMLVSVREVQIWKMLDVLMGACVLTLALERLSHTIGLSQALGFAVSLCTGGVIVYSFWVVLATMTFWFVRVDNILVVFQTMYEAGRWPVGIYPPWLRAAVTFLVPVAFAVTVPAEALVGRLTLTSLAGSAALAAALLVASRKFWSCGVQHYTGASA